MDDGTLHGITNEDQMATDTRTMTSPGRADGRPYPPSWLHALLGWIERLPGPTWAAYGGIALVMVLLTHAQHWSKGTAPFGSFDFVSTYWGLLTVAMLWAAG